MIATSTQDFRRGARRRLPRFLFDYIDGGAGDERTLDENQCALRTVALRQRVLRDVAAIDLRTNLFGQEVAAPLVLAPVGLTGLYARRGERQAARAASRRDVPFCLSTVSVCSIEEVARDCTAPFWFQLYVIRDRGFMRDLIARAKAAGASALVFTVDMPVPGARRRDAHSGLSGPYAGLRRGLQIVGKPAWAWSVGVMGRPHILGNVAPVLGKSSGLEDFMGWLAQNFDPSIRWSDLEWIRAEWDGPLIIKGILDPDDARDAVRFGADGIVVSNHGGRQLDGAIATARALPSIADAVGSDITVLADSGIRSGVDVLRMMALGARGVLLGRAWVYALAAAGGKGVSDLIDIYLAEMRTAMALAGISKLSQVDQSLIDSR
ncbi:MAG: L-lactate dehydrogenase [Sphingobium sp.]|uniref:FMN-dependent L-lactate dehydrogenase LldD n=1 Tax=Sphingobium sp. TaxID=1912891 RepID=UPI000DB38AE1|nr:FMN-dependent L-lactate dehydrogenase LldD [Sphingobium sp.]PZU12234.1 MAG: L-lactate dehydrogenase [Sphingobium sp.]